jgi:phosphatidylglycerol:prolipoprotein diacylglycerol transferase
LLVHPDFDPVALHLGPLAIKWYGLMYLAGFGLGFWLGRKRILAGLSGRITLEVLDDILFYAVLGIVLGGRLGYVLFYKPDWYLSHPLDILHIWEGGMSFHGGFLGVLAAMLLVARKHGLRWIELMDFVAPLVPPGIAAGRIGNFINGELFGRVSDLPWAMVFRGGGPMARHPSQLYEFALEGCVLFGLLWVYSSRPRPPWSVSAVFLIGYGAMRSIAECFREPDDFLGFLGFGLTMGQWLSLPMVAIGVLMLILAGRGQPAASPRPAPPDPERR